MGTAEANLAKLRQLIERAEDVRGRSNRGDHYSPIRWLSEVAWEEELHPILESLQLDPIEDDQVVAVLTYLEDLEVNYRCSPLGYVLNLLVERHRDKYEGKVKLPMAPA